MSIIKIIADREYVSQVISENTIDFIKSVNGVQPDESGNVQIEINIDATLTQEGQAADAKAVGDAIANIGAPTDEQVNAAVSDYLAENPVQPGTNIYIGPNQPTNGAEYWLDTSSGGEEEPDATTYSITNNLTNVTSDNAAISVEANTSYSANLTAVDGYKLDSVTVTMGGVDITATAYADGVVSIAAVTGDVVVTATAVLTELPDITTFVLSEPWLTNTYTTNGNDPNSNGGGAAIAAGVASDDVPLTDYFSGAYDTLYAVVFRPNASDPYNFPIGWSIDNRIIQYYTPIFNTIASLTVGMSDGAYVDGNRLRWMLLKREDVLTALADTEYSADDVRRISQKIVNVGSKNYNIKVAWMTSEPTAEQQQAIIDFFENGGEL